MTYVIGEPCVDELNRACEDDPPEKWRGYAAESSRLCAGSPRGRDEPLGSPGATKPGQAGSVTPVIASLPAQR